MARAIRTTTKPKSSSKAAAKATASATVSEPSAPAVLKNITLADPAAIRAFAVEAARLIRDDKCEDVVVLDVNRHSQVTDYLIIGSGTSERQMRSVLQHVEELGAKRGFNAFRSHTDERSTWLLLDFVDVVVHLFEPNIRAHYDLETLWSDAKRVDWERPDQMKRDRAGLND
jgi:ribosome-associated protein